MRPDPVTTGTVDYRRLEPDFVQRGFLVQRADIAVKLQISSYALLTPPNA
jgi:hypothetical protein